MRSKRHKISGLSSESLVFEPFERPINAQDASHVPAFTHCQIQGSYDNPWCCFLICGQYAWEVHLLSHCKGCCILCIIFYRCVKASCEALQCTACSPSHSFCYRLSYYGSLQKICKGAHITARQYMPCQDILNRFYGMASENYWSNLWDTQQTPCLLRHALPCDFLQISPHGRCLHLEMVLHHEAYSKVQLLTCTTSKLPLGVHWASLAQNIGSKANFMKGKGGLTCAARAEQFALAEAKTAARRKATDLSSALFLAVCTSKLRHDTYISSHVAFQNILETCDLPALPSRITRKITSSVNLCRSVLPWAGRVERVYVKLARQDYLEVSGSRHGRWLSYQSWVERSLTLDHDNFVIWCEDRVKIRRHLMPGKVTRLPLLAQPWYWLYKVDFNVPARLKGLHWKRTSENIRHCD